jgi:hypothetical protein
MDPALPYYFLAVAALAFPLGYLSSWLSTRRKMRRMEKDSWAAARSFYLRRFAQGERE